MEYENLIFEKAERVGLIILNRPQRLNSLSVALQAELVSVIELMENDDEVGAAIITGSPRPDGRPCFSAGVDLKEVSQTGKVPSEKHLGTLEQGMFRTLAASGESRDQWQFVFNRVQQFSKPIIAAIDGICTAGGLELAMACDIRYVSETAQVGDLHMKNLGVLGGGGLQTWITRLVGIGKAKDLVWTGYMMNGKETVEAGLAQRVFPPDKLLEETKKIARQMASYSPVAMKLSKMVMNSSLNQGTYDSLRFSAFCEALQRYIQSGDKTRFREFAERK